MRGSPLRHVVDQLEKSRAVGDMHAIEEPPAEDFGRRRIE